MKRKPADLGPCAICGRPMSAGPGVDTHHFVPKSEGGRVTTPLHRICHRKIHSLFNERELARDYNSPASLLAHADIRKFVQWVGNKHPDYFDRSRTAKSKRR